MTGRTHLRAYADRALTDPGVGFHRVRRGGPARTHAAPRCFQQVSTVALGLRLTASIESAHAVTGPGQASAARRRHLTYGDDQPESSNMACPAYRAGFEESQGLFEAELKQLDRGRVP